MTEDSSEDTLDELSQEEARRMLIQLIVRQDIAEHADIYEELARE